MNERRTVQREVLFEMQPKGRYLRVTAIDPLTGIEVISICDSKYPLTMIKRIAARKLFYVLRKRGRNVRPPQQRGILA